MEKQTEVVLGIKVQHRVLYADQRWVVGAAFGFSLADVAHGAPAVASSLAVLPQEAPVGKDSHLGLCPCVLLSSSFVSIGVPVQNPLCPTGGHR
ncbi:Hypothetical predicted protein, partial [Marmota monax]